MTPNTSLSATERLLAHRKPHSFTPTILPQKRCRSAASYYESPIKKSRFSLVSDADEEVLFDGEESSDLEDFIDHDEHVVHDDEEFQLVATQDQDEQDISLIYDSEDEQKRLSNKRLDDSHSEQDEEIIPYEDSPLTHEQPSSPSRDKSQKRKTSLHPSREKQVFTAEKRHDSHFTPFQDSDDDLEYEDTIQLSHRSIQQKLRELQQLAMQEQQDEESCNQQHHHHTSASKVSISSSNITSRNALRSLNPNQIHQPSKESSLKQKHIVLLQQQRKEKENIQQNQRTDYIIIH